MKPTAATPEKTRAYFETRELHPDKIRTLDGLAVSALAVGTYLGDSDDATDRLYEEALVHAGLGGVNFFDTAVNYRCQRSERAIAYALRKLAGLGVPREALVVATKGGFLPADGRPEEFQSYVYKHFLNTGLIKPDDIVANCHCMTPDYLRAQISLSLANLKTDAIDLYYLHNPEMQLKETGAREFYARLTRAFAVFEEEAQAGRIRRYGVATWNGFRRPFGADDLLDMDKILSCAKEAGGPDHRFRAVQLPYNPALLEAAALPNQKSPRGELPALAAAAHHGLAVLVSAPLLQSQIARLPDRVFEAMPGRGTKMQKALQFAVSSPGVVAAMTGMKLKVHVDENLEILKSADWPVEELKKIAPLLVRS